MPRGPGMGGGQRTATPAGRGGAGGPRQVWVVKDGQPVAVRVQTGITDGRMTEVSSPELEAGTQVIVDQRATDK